MTTLDATIDAALEAGLRLDGTEDIREDTRLADLTFSAGDRTLIGVEFLCAFEEVFAVNFTQRQANRIVNRMEKGLGTVAKLAEIIDGYITPVRRPRMEGAKDGNE